MLHLPCSCSVQNNLPLNQILTWLLAQPCSPNSINLSTTYHSPIILLPTPPELWWVPCYLPASADGSAGTKWQWRGGGEKRKKRNISRMWWACSTSEYTVECAIVHKRATSTQKFNSKCMCISIIPKGQGMLTLTHCISSKWLKAATVLVLPAPSPTTMEVIQHT